MPGFLLSRVVVWLTLLGAFLTLASWLKPPALITLAIVMGVLAIQALPVYVIYLVWLSRHRRRALESIAEIGGRVTARLAADPRCILEIDLSGTNVADLKWESLHGLAHLESLDLSHTATTDDHLELLSQQMLPALKTLILDHTSITDEGLHWLRDFPQLNFVSLSQTRITEEGLDTVSRTKPQLHIEALG